MALENHPVFFPPRSMAWGCQGPKNQKENNFCIAGKHSTSKMLIFFLCVHFQTFKLAILITQHTHTTHIVGILHGNITWTVNLYLHYPKKPSCQMFCSQPLPWKTHTEIHPSNRQSPEFLLLVLDTTRFPKDLALDLGGWGDKGEGNLNPSFGGWWIKSVDFSGSCKGW